MPFIGNQPALSYTSFAKQDFTTSATTSYTLDHPVANENEIALFINFVRQEPTTAYTASGTTLTLTSATSASDDMYCVFLGKAVQTVNPPNGSVGTSQLASTAVTPAKMDLSQDYTFTGAVSGHNYPAFEARLSAHQANSDLATSKVLCDTVVFDTGSYYDNATNYRYTPLVAGKYLVYAQTAFDTTSGNARNLASYIYKNGSIYSASFVNFDANDGEGASPSTSVIIDMNGSTDYLELYAFTDVLSGTCNIQGQSYNETFFGAYRIGA